MVSRAPLTVLVGLGMGVLALVLTGQGWIIPRSFFAPVSIVVSTLTTALLLWDHWLWRIPWLHPWPVSRPVLRGTWRGEIMRSEGAPIVVFLAIEQRWSEVTYRTFTAESCSASVVATVFAVDGHFVLAALYRNEPDLLVQDRSRPHRGAMWLRVGDPSGARLDGAYWTDRDTKGELRFERVSTSVAGDLEAARKLAERASQSTRAQRSKQRIAPG